MKKLQPEQTVAIFGTGLLLVSVWLASFLFTIISPAYYFALVVTFAIPALIGLVLAIMGLYATINN